MIWLSYKNKKKLRDAEIITTEGISEMVQL